MTRGEYLRHKRELKGVGTRQFARLLRYDSSAISTREYSLPKLESSLVTAQLAPVKSGNKTSTFLVTLTGIIVTSIPGTLFLLAANYQYTRYKTMNGKRQATAQVAQAQASILIRAKYIRAMSNVPRLVNCACWNLIQLLSRKAAALIRSGFSVDLDLDGFGVLPSVATKSA